MPISTDTVALIPGRDTGDVAPTQAQDANDVMKSAMILEAAGFRLVPLSHPIAPWQLLGVSPQGLMLCHVCRGDWPSTLGVLFGFPPGLPLSTRRLLHKWTDGEPWPAVRAL